MLNVLFLQDDIAENIVQPEFSITISYFKALFNWINFYLTTVLDKKTALIYLVGLVISSNLLTNFFRFGSRYILAFVKARMVKTLGCKCSKK